MNANIVNSPQYNLSVVIPVLNAAEYLNDLLGSIQRQHPCGPKEIILIDSKSKDNTKEIALSYPNVRVIEIKNFSHGRSRNLGARHARGDIVVFLTQDALPKDENWLCNLLEVFKDEKVAAGYSRQVPRPDAPFTERFFLETRFPEIPIERKKDDETDKLTFEKVFFSNVSSAVRRSILLQYPFDENLIMSEDQQLSRDLIAAGYTVAYAPRSVVIHSHKYTLKVAFKRYFDSVYSLTGLFPSHGIGTSYRIGIKYLLKEIKYVLNNYPHKIPYYIAYTIVKSAGVLLGHFAEKMPRFLLKKLSLHSYHWK